MFVFLRQRPDADLRVAEELLVTQLEPVVIKACGEAAILGALVTKLVRARARPPLVMTAVVRR